MVELRFVPWSLASLSHWAVLPLIPKASVPKVNPMVKDQAELR